MTLLLVATLAAAGPKLAVPAFSGGRPELAAFCSERLADELVGEGFEVVSEKQIGALLGLERQRQLAGCADGGSACFAELTNALGADAVVSGSLALLGKRIAVDVRVFSAKTGKPLAVTHDEASSEAELPALIARLADDLALAVRGDDAPVPRGPRLGVWLPLGAGLIFAIGSGAMFAAAASHHQTLTSEGMLTPRLSYEAAQQTASAMGANQTIGWVLAAVAGAAILTGALVWLFGSAS